MSAIPVELKATVESGDPDLAPLGYKRVDAWTIPSDWDARALGELAVFRTGPFGSALHKADYVDGGIPLINPMHIVDGRLVPEPNVSVSEQAARRLAVFRLHPGDIIIGRRGELGRCAVARRVHSGWLCGTGSLIIRCREQVDPEFLQRLLTTRRVVRAIEDASVGSTMVNLNQAALAGLTIPCPPTAEQHLIAEVLSDVDGLLGALERLIAKKRAIKQSAMQQLLTGNARLSGFSGRWETKRIGDISIYLPTAHNPRSDLSEHGDAEYIHYGDIHAHSRPVLDCAFTQLPRIDKRRTGNAAELQDGDLVMVDASEDLVGVGKSVEIRGATGRNVVAGLHTILCRGTPNHWAIGFKAYLQFIPALRSALTRVTSGISVYATSRRQLADVKLALPPVPEQEAIVAVLSEMDTEVAALEQRWDKTRAIRLGMMQQLLTGRARLVKPQHAEASG